MTVLHNATHLIEGQITSVNNTNLTAAMTIRKLLWWQPWRLLIQQTATNLSSEICYDTVIQSHWKCLHLSTEHTKLTAYLTPTNR